MNSGSLNTAKALMLADRARSSFGMGRFCANRFNREGDGHSLAVVI